MSPRVALACCSIWPDGSGDHAGLPEALHDRGVRAEWVPWDAAVDWSGFDLVLLRETWDYPPKLASFLDWIDSVATVTAVANPPAVVRWNHHKGYLHDLSAAGIPVVPTTIVTRGTQVPFAALQAVDDLVVVKPAVGIGGDDAERGRAGDPATAKHLSALVGGGDALVQPYLESIESSGETSVVVLGGRVTHAVRKLPTRGEFRIHEHRGGSYSQVEPAAAQVEVALSACEAAASLTGEDLLYARADLIAGVDGAPLLMELELIEPSLYLHTVPAATVELADLIVAVLSR